LAGTTINVSGDGCAPNTPVYVVLDPTSTPTSLPPAGYLAMANSKANGQFVVPTPIPASTSLGAHTLVAYCVQSNGAVLSQSLRINVIAAGTSTGSVGTTGSVTTGASRTTGTVGSTGPLARTGAPNHLGSLYGIGAAAIVLGASFVYGATRRRKGSSPA